MSKPRKRWWGYVRQVLYAYPRLMNHTETETEEREKEAVEAALEGLIAWPDGKETLQIIADVFFQRDLTLTGAALRGNMSYRTARRRQNEFIRQVGKNMGLL